MFSPVDMASLPSWKIWDRRDSQLATEEIAVRGEYMMKLEQLQRLRSENTPTAPWLPILLIHSGSQVKTRQSQSYKFQEFAKNSFFFNFETIFNMTHLMKLLDKMCKNEMDLASIVEDR